MRSQKGHTPASIRQITFTYECFRFVEYFIDDLFLLIHNAGDTRLEQIEKHFVFVRHIYSTRDNQRCTGIVYQYGIRLIYYGVVVFFLHQFLRKLHHIIP